MGRIIPRGKPERTVPSASVSLEGPITPSFSPWISHFNIRKEPLTTSFTGAVPLWHRRKEEVANNPPTLPRDSTNATPLAVSGSSISCTKRRRVTPRHRPTVQELTTPAPPEVVHRGVQMSDFGGLLYSNGANIISTLELSVWVQPLLKGNFAFAPKPDEWTSLR